jgi:hypothetical protein
MKLPVREPPRTRSEFHHGRGREPKPLKVGLQFPCKVHFQVNATSGPFVSYQREATGARSAEDGAQFPATVPTESL